MKGHFLEGIIFLLLIVAFTLVATFRQAKDKTLPLTTAEKKLITGADSVMYVLDVSNVEDSLMLRTRCLDFSDKDLRSPWFGLLGEKMLATVSSPQQDGVGIAAPQVGIPRRLIAVCRMDKPGDPFELYPNVRIDTLYGPIGHGPEGCLSIVPYRGVVPRYESVVVSYSNVNTLQRIRDTISGYTAIIFQHECDHLDGVLYIDKADTVYVNETWKVERDSLASLGFYDRPASLDLTSVLTAVSRQ